MIKQHSVLFKLMLSVVLIKECCFIKKSVEYEYATIYFSVPKRGDANIRGVLHLKGLRYFLAGDGGGTQLERGP